jgi:hypothetical protein
MGILTDRDATDRGCVQSGEVPMNVGKVTPVLPYSMVTLRPTVNPSTHRLCQCIPCLSRPLWNFWKRDHYPGFR